MKHKRKDNLALIFRNISRAIKCDLLPLLRFFFNKTDGRRILRSYVSFFSCDAKAKKSSAKARDSNNS